MQSINLRDELFIDDEGIVYPIIGWYNVEGECEKAEAITAVAGAGNRWYMLVLADFVSALTH